MTSTPEDVWNPMVPELTVGDLETSLQFYTRAGFRVKFRRSEPPFAYLELGKVQLMLEQEHATGWTVAPLERPLGRGVNFQIEVPDVKVVRAGFSAIGPEVFRDLREAWYAVSAELEEGQREFLVQDPDGYLLRFAEYLGRRRASPRNRDVSR